MSLFVVETETGKRPTVFSYFLTALIVVTLLILALWEGGIIFKSSPSTSTPNQPGTPGVSDGGQAGNVISKVTIPAESSSTGKNQEIKIQFAKDWPASLKLDLKFNPAGPQIEVSGTRTNMGIHTISWNEIVYFLDSDEGEYHTLVSGFSMVPGETQSVQTSIVFFSARVPVAKTITIKALGFNEIIVTPLPTEPTVTPTETATPTETTPKSGSWEKTVQTKYGPFTIKYTETASAMGRVLVTMDNPEYGAVRVKNITNGAIEVIVSQTCWDTNGNVVNVNKETFSLAPGESDQQGGVPTNDSVTTEIKVEVK